MQVAWLCLHALNIGSAESTHAVRGYAGTCAALVGRHAKWSTRPLDAAVFVFRCFDAKGRGVQQTSESEVAEEREFLSITLSCFWCPCAWRSRKQFLQHVCSWSTLLCACIWSCPLHAGMHIQQAWSKLRLHQLQTSCSYVEI
jgi:hypothetical protein